MIRQLFNLTIAITLSATAFFVSAGPTLANHLECETADPHDVLPANGGRVTVVYENELLRSPAFPDAAVIAAHLKERADAALQRYDVLGFPVPSAVTISIKCRLTAVGVIEINPDVPGFTDDFDSVQLRNDYVRSQFAEPTWTDERAGWKNLVDHEMFHTSHHLMANLGWDYVAAAEKTIVESGATLAQDFFLDGDDEGNPDAVPDNQHSYYRSVERFFTDPSTIAADTEQGTAAYDAAAFLQYLGERFGSQAEPNLERRVADWLETLATADGVRIDAMRNAIDPDAEVNVVYEALLDFLIAAYVPDHPNLADKHKILDEHIGHGGQGTGSSYPAMDAVITGLGQPVPTQLLTHDEPQAHSITLPAGTTQVAVTFEASPELVLPGTLYVAVVPIDDGEARVDAGLRTVVFPDRRPQGRIIQVAGAEELAIFTVSAHHGTRYDLTVADVGGNPDLVVLDPTQNRPRPIGPSIDPEQLTVEVLATVGGLAANGLTAGAFDVAIDNEVADVLAAVQIGTGRYDLLVQPPVGLPDGEVDLSVTFADAAIDTQTNAVIVGESPGAAVAIVIDNSGSMAGSRIAAAQDAAVQFVADMELGDEVAVVAFNSGATVAHALVELTDETVRQSVTAAINAITTSGGTNLASGINAGNQQLASASVGFARAQVFLSDGEDSSNIATAIANTPADVDIHTIALDAGSNQARLQQIADGTGGAFFFASDESQLANLYALIRARITDAEFSHSEDLGLIGLGQAESRTVPVLAGLDDIRFGARWIGSDYDLTLTAPSGRIITEASTDADVTIEHGANFVDITVTEPEAGAWQVSVEGVDLPGGPEPVSLEVEEDGATLRSDLHLTSDGGAGTPLQARFVLTEPAGPVLGADVIATITDPSGVTRSIRLTDDGGPVDGSAGDGVYGTLLWGTDLAGSYTVSASASGVATDGAFSRFEVASTVLDTKVDTDGDGIADGAEAYFGFDPNNPADGALDLDVDGLTTSAELALGTDPRRADTDGGGEADGSEVSGTRDPFDAADDQPTEVPIIGVVPADGGILTVIARTESGDGNVRLERLSDAGSTDLGSHPGSGVTLSDGPLPTGEYWYQATGVSGTGSESAPVVIGPFEASADVTPPSMRIIVNGGSWEAIDTEVSIEFADLSEPVVEMRFAESEEDLATAAWVPYVNPTTFTVQATSGVHLIWAQVRDAAGLVSAASSGVIELPEPPTLIGQVSGSSQGSKYVISGSGSATAETTVSVEYRISKVVAGNPQPIIVSNWGPAKATDGTFDSSSEDFTFMRQVQSLNVVRFLVDVRATAAGISTTEDYTIWVQCPHCFSDP